ncbi:MAG: SMI1/KNR4 family protein [Chitinophagales bacterium]|jgi:hypothetical protein|nr:SMI1/KNR4 family protein [Chitinophagales bacterium]
MEKLIRKIEEKWNRNTNTSIQILNEFENNHSLTLPTDYEAFMKWSNGGEGFIGNNYLSIWKIESLIQLNFDYSIQKYLGEKILMFGTDGGSYGYAFDLRNKDNISIIGLSLGDIDLNEIEQIAPSFEEFILKLINGN